MLELQLTPRHAGLYLWGDFAALESLYRFIHHVLRESSHIEDKRGFVLNLADDICRALNHQDDDRYRIRFDDDNHPTRFKDERSRVYGLPALWPMLLTQLGLLRYGMAFMPTNKLDQAIMFELEYIVERGLRAAIPIMADEVLYSVGCIGGTAYTHIDYVIDSRCRYFVGLSADERLRTLPSLMKTFDPGYVYGPDTPEAIRTGRFPVNAFAYGKRVTWPDFEW
ncbi:hypothetical protein HZU77_001070 [Neisseriaceae bacterium TC5R-5]|nr:hypothetical protein [Neisseriaceae bacterium TC5R-5]